MGYLYKYYEADNVAVASGSPLSAGTEIKDYVIPNGEVWQIHRFGGSSDNSNTEVELLYSDDAGSTWCNPFDSSTNKLCCLHINSQPPSPMIWSQGFEFVGSGTNCIIRLKFKNWDSSKTSEITGWIEGKIR